MLSDKNNVVRVKKKKFEIFLDKSHFITGRVNKLHTGEETKYNKTEVYIPLVQKSCLEIVKKIDNICRNNHIQYSLCGGSVIGAYLYKGFIPWDDDIDLMMDRNNYDKFLDVLSKETGNRYRLLNYRTENTIDVPTLFSRVEDLNTEVTEVIAGCTRKGHVFVDITVMDNIKSNIHHTIAFFLGGYVCTKLYHYNGMIPGTGWKKVLFNLLGTHANREKTIKLYTWYEDYCRKNKNAKTKYCAELLSAAYSKYRYKREFFDSYVDIPFENTKLMVIRDYMDYLQIRYGRREFTKDVPVENRFNSHIIHFRELS